MTSELSQHAVRLLLPFANRYSSPALTGGDQMKAWVAAVRGVWFWQILLKKSRLGDERNFSGLLVRTIYSDVRDHIASHESDHRPGIRSRSPIAAAAPRIRRSPEFWSCSIFEFFNSIGTFETCRPPLTKSVYRVDRKWLVHRQADAIDPTETLVRRQN